MNEKTITDAIQWVGTACILAMYVLMTFFKEMYPWNVVAGLLGSICFLTWSYRTNNIPQMLVNLVGGTVCIVGLLTLKF